MVITQLSDASGRSGGSGTPGTSSRFRKRRIASVALALAAACAVPALPAAAHPAHPARPTRAAAQPPAPTAPTRVAVTRTVAARAVPARPCPTRAGRVACVDLTHQRMWVQQGPTARRVYRTVPIRSGRAGFRTRTGWFKVYWRHIDHVSSIYGVAMPYSQFFSGGEAFHSIAGSVYAPPGSHGCVNLRPADARRLWNVLRKGDAVYVWGRKPGT